MEKVAAKPLGVKQVPTESLKANPHNPRLLFDKRPMDALQDSVERNGILVPLTVYKEARTGHYVILDGQRRWICAQRVGLHQVPVNEVEEPSLVANIVTMFQIHKLREDWELMPTALKLDLLMSEINDRNNKRLAILTGLDEAVVVRCKKLLSYERKYQEMMLDPNPDRRTKADLFIELYPVRTDRVVREFDWFNKVKFTDQMIEKFEAGVVKSVTDFRTVKQYISNAVKAGEVGVLSERLRCFAEERNRVVDTLSISEAQSKKQARSIMKQVSELIESLDELEVESLYGELAMWESLEQLQGRIGALLAQADRRPRQ